MEESDIKFSEDELDKILKEKWSGKNQTRYVKIKNCTLPESYLKFQKEIDDFEVYDSDIWICSFPRTGTTWTSEMVWLIANNFDYEKAKVASIERIPFLDFSFLMGGKDKSTMSEAMADPINVAKNRPQPRFIKSHLPFQLLPKQIQSGEKKPKIIYVCRNPLDACTSFFHFSSIGSFSGSFEEFCKLFLSNRVIFGDTWDHILGFWKIRNEPNVLFLKYEDMKADLGKVIRHTSTFLEKSASDEDVRKLQDHLSFESMKNNPAVNHGRPVDPSEKSKSAQGAFIRSGVVGGYKEEMPPYFIKLFEERTKSKFKGTDLKF